jgi:hypothetical protein
MTAYRACAGCDSPCGCPLTTAPPPVPDTTEGEIAGVRTAATNEENDR